jgi:hypothetical protein
MTYILNIDAVRSKLTLRSRVILEKLIVPQLVKKFQHLMNPNICYCIHKSPLCLPVLSQINPVHASPSYLLKIYFSIILSSMPRSSNGFFSYVSACKFCMHLCTSPHIVHATPISLICIIKFRWKLHKTPVRT